MDTFWLNTAFYQASQVLGNTGRNPAVGCVLINKNQIVGVGATSVLGRPHAEENAIKMAGKNALGSTMYITLEPCNIANNKNSCTKNIIRHGIKKVVIGMLDPNPATYKKGYQELILNGIEVCLKKISFNNYLFNYSQICIHKKKRPMFALKLASSIDGKITNVKDKNQWITSKFAREHVHHVRSFYDGILIGTNTMKVDNPKLNTRIEGYKKSNYKIVFDKNLDIKEGSNLLKNIKKNPLIIFTNISDENDKFKKLIKKGVQVFNLDLNKNGLFNFSSLIKEINRFNIKSILVEGGARTASEFLNKKLIDIIYLYRSNSFIGNEELDMLSNVNKIDKFKLYNKIMLDDNQLEIWINKNL